MVRRLAELFRRNGYVRKCDLKRRAKLKSSYHRGDEIRLVADTRAELGEIRRLLRAAGFKPGRPFDKAKQFRQPVYGRTEVARFLALIGDPGNPRPPRVAAAKPPRTKARKPTHAPVPQRRRAKRGPARGQSHPCLGGPPP
ncbi:MAG TPA: hypothetical protein VFG68_06245 [Fimbriiglobus sp.]|nr:hypothetical protein [Fimbriiglobus sp.]